MRNLAEEVQLETLQKGQIENEHKIGINTIWAHYQHFRRFDFFQLSISVGKNSELQK